MTHTPSGWLLVLLALAPRPAHSFNDAREIDAHACRSVVERRLEAWGGSMNAWIRAPSGPLGDVVFEAPTGEIGVWVTLHVSKVTGLLQMYRIDARETTRVVVSEDCRESVHETATDLGVPAGPSFSDAALEERLESGSPLVVYSWSPHLPLSVDGYHEIAGATATLGLELVAVLDPSADADYARRVAEEGGIPSHALRRAASVELLFRDLAVHAPSVLVFDGHRVVGPLPGYRDARAYVAYLNRFAPSE